MLFGLTSPNQNIFAKCTHINIYGEEDACQKLTVNNYTTHVLPRLCSKMLMDINAVYFLFAIARYRKTPHDSLRL